jgi:hypothetical protein
MLWFSKDVDEQKLRRMFPDATIKLAPWFDGYHEGIKRLVTFASVEAEDAALAKLGYGKLKDVKQEPRQ